MFVSNFANPVETVQNIAILCYLNTLSDFLYSENLLEENDIYKKVPIINGLYEYFAINRYDTEEKLILIRKLLEGTNLYGEKENELVDVNFVNTMFGYIINSFVFEEYGNIYGFLAEVIRSSENITVNTLHHNIQIILKNLTFQNAYGNDSQLTSLAAEGIFQDFILPLFPIPKTNLTIISLDYIYAQAGLMFCRSEKINTAYFSKTNTRKDDVNDPNSIFDEYIGIAHIIENLVGINKVEKFALNIFSLPALFHYVYKHKEVLKNTTMQDIINDPIHWSKAYKFLFLYINPTLEQLDIAHDNDYRYQLHLALTNFKNRTMIAREKVKMYCANKNENDFERNVAEYKKLVTNFKCVRGNRIVTLPNLNTVFDKQINDVRNKYFQFEKELIREAFGEKFIKKMNKLKFIITEGSFVHQTIEPSIDLLQFYYPDKADSEFYALLRNDYNITLIGNKENHTVFYQKLGIDANEKFATVDLTNPLKSIHENFEDFILKLAENRAYAFEKHFHSFDFGPKEEDWWEEFGLSLIPFYSCITSSIKGNIIDALISCPMDTMLLFSLVGEIEVIGAKITTAATRYLYSEVGITLRTRSLRETILSLLKINKNALIRETAEIRNSLEKNMYNDLGHSLMRLNDPGIELDFILNEDGLTSISELITQVEDATAVEFKSVKRLLEKTKDMVTSPPKMIGNKFGKEVYVKTLDKISDSGYGYKFIYLPNNKIAQLRYCQESEDEILVLFDGISMNNEKLFAEIDTENMAIKENYFVEKDNLLVKFPETEPAEIDSPINNEGYCYFYRNKRSPTDSLHCPRTRSLSDEKERIYNAVDYALTFKTHKEPEIQSVLRKFYFPPGGKTEMDFIKEWMDNDKFVLPHWSKEYIVDESDLFYDLRYRKKFDSKHIPDEETITNIINLYGKSDLFRFGRTTKSMRKKYIEQRAYYSVSFEDYYAIGNQQGVVGSKGFSRIGDSTDEGRRMRNALYRLAIRQIDSSIDEFPQKLFRGEKRPQKVLEKLFARGKADFKFGRFTSASRNVETAKAFALKEKTKEQKVLYEISFSGKYLSARVEKIYPTILEESVLLPDSIFHIESISKEVDEHIGDYFRVVLQYKHETIGEEVKNVMTELKKLKASGTQFYHDEPPTKRISSTLFKDCINSKISL